MGVDVSGLVDALGAALFFLGEARPFFSDGVDGAAGALFFLPCLSFLASIFRCFSSSLNSSISRYSGDSRGGEWGWGSRLHSSLRIHTRLLNQHAYLQLDRQPAFETRQFGSKKEAVGPPSMLPVPGGGEVHVCTFV